MLSDFYIEEHVKKALEEDIGFGDITSEYLADTSIINCTLSTREDGIFCGKSVFEKVFKILSPEINITFYKNDGDEIIKDDKIALIQGPARYILMGERVALNYTQRMSGIATETHKYQQALNGYKAKIADTRKTTPLFRAFEKYSVKVGGGSLHRFNLSDCAMIKDNHIKYAGGIKEAVERLRQHLSHAHKVEIECDTYEQVLEALEAKADIIMLDNMDYHTMEKCVEVIGDKAMTEASGGVNIEKLQEIAKTGVDIISTSAIVAKAPTLDLGLDM